MAKTLAVFDFDETMINGNIDIIIMDAMPSLLPSEKNWMDRYSVWTDYMDNIFQQMHSNGITNSLMEKAVCSALLLPSIPKICEDLSQHENTDMVVLSDANTLFIKLILEHNKMLQLFKKVYSNPAEFTVDGRVSIQHYHQHSCQRCPANLCKGKVLEQIMAEENYSQVIYFGDGHGDICPALSLRSSDAVFARSGYPLSRNLQGAKKQGKLRSALYTPDFTTDDYYKQFCSALSSDS